MEKKSKTKSKQTEIGEIPEDWEVRKLEEVCLKIRGAIISGPFGSNISSRFFVEKGIPVIRGNNLSTDFDKFIDDGFVFVTKEKADELNTWADEDDLVFTAAGTLGQVGIIPKKRKYERYIISNKQLRARLDKKIMVPLFAFYWFQSKRMIEYINLRNTGSTIPLINLSVLKSLPLPYPEIKEQQSIAKILSDLDSKIELNQQMNKKLEAMGQTIFKHWFFDFEFQNEEGKPYKSSGGEMVYNEVLKREIPKGWGVKNIQKILEFEKGVEPGSKWYLTEPSEDCIKFIRVGNISTSGREQIFIPINLADEKFCNEEDILISLDATIGIVRIGMKGSFSSGIRKVYSKKKGAVPKGYIYSLLKSKYVQDTIYTYANGTTILHAGSSLNHMNLPIPDEKIFLKFSEISDPIFEKMINNLIEINNFEQVRDSLLPKLMSGKIRVPVEVRR